MHYPFWKKNSKPCGFFGCGSEKTGMGSPLIPSSVRWAVQKSMSWTASGKGVWTYAIPKRELEDRWIANMQSNLANDLVFATKGRYIYIHITYIQYIYIIYNIYLFILIIYICTYMYKSRWIWNIHTVCCICGCAHTTACGWGRYRSTAPAVGSARSFYADKPLRRSMWWRCPIINPKLSSNKP